MLVSVNVGKFAVNPARAGMILKIPSKARLWKCKPRASGDDPARHMNLIDAVE